MSNEKRYKVIEGSVSAHCCFLYTVSDTTIKGEWPGDSTICETFEEEWAIAIAEAMNERELTRIAEGLLANSNKE